MRELFARLWNNAFSRIDLAKRRERLHAEAGLAPYDEARTSRLTGEKLYNKCAEMSKADGRVEPWSELDSATQAFWDTAAREVFDSVWMDGR